MVLSNLTVKRLDRLIKGGVRSTRIQLELLDQMICKGTTKQRAADQTEGGAGHTDGKTCSISHVGNRLAEGTAISMTTDHGGGASQEAIDRFDSSCEGKHNTQNALYRNQYTAEYIVNNNVLSALLQTLHTRGKADTSKERNHGRRLISRIKFKTQNPCHVKNAVNERKCKATGYRGRNAETLQKRNMIPEIIAQKQ